MMLVTSLTLLALQGIFENVVQIALFAGSSKSLNFSGGFILLWAASSNNVIYHHMVASLKTRRVL
jgi:hypothetical protein